jgi:acetylornithine/succinyldiaminopimelate/putrescine aminotransferase
LSYGALAATAYKDGFRRPFEGQLGGHVTHLPYGVELDLIDQLLTGPATGGESIGTILVEPIQGRGGEVVPPTGWLTGLRELANRHGLALVFDEIYTGLGRTGRWWGGDHEGVVPDILTVGKALGGGMPLSACIARPDVMAAWTMDGGEAIHTATFLGHPVCAAAGLAAIDVLEALDAPACAQRIEAAFRARFPDRIRGRGAMLGLETGSPGEGARMAGELLKAGWIVLPGGIQGDILGITPPLVLSDVQLAGALDALETALAS